MKKKRVIVLKAVDANLAGREEQKILQLFEKRNINGLYLNGEDYMVRHECDGCTSCDNECSMKTPFPLNLVKNIREFFTRSFTSDGDICVVVNASDAPFNTICHTFKICDIEFEVVGCLHDEADRI